MIRINLSRLLGERRLTQAYLSQHTGIRANTIHALYHGFADRIKFEHIEKICRVLKCEVGELIEIVNEDPEIAKEDAMLEKDKRK